MFSKEDEVLHKGLMKLLDDATFHLQAREVKAFLVIYDWVKNLPRREEQPKIKQKRNTSGHK